MGIGALGRLRCIDLTLSCLGKGLELLLYVGLERLLIDVGVEGHITTVGNVADLHTFFFEEGVF